MLNELVVSANILVSEWRMSRDVIDKFHANVFGLKEMRLGVNCYYFKSLLWSSIILNKKMLILN